MKLPKIPRYVVGLSAVGTLVGGFVLLKEFTGGKQYEGNERLDHKTVVITGATSGIGKATAENLAARGGKIILACRDMEKCATVCQELIAATKNKDIYCRHLDLSSINSINNFAKEFNRTEERLDILINNAGIMSKKRNVTVDGFEKHIGVNFLGRFLLTNLLLEKMKSTESWGRIINVVCIGHNSVYMDFSDFNNEKYYKPEVSHKKASLANLNFTAELADILKGSDIGVYSVNPGMAETDIRREFGTHNSSFSGFLLKPLWVTFFKLPRQACQTVLFAALSHELEGKPQHSGKLFHDMREGIIKEGVVNPSVRRRLWMTAEYWTKLRDHNSSAQLLHSSSPLTDSTSTKNIQPSSSIAH